jgi:hypothetical protein
MRSHSQQLQVHTYLHWSEILLASGKEYNLDTALNTLVSELLQR